MNCLTEYDEEATHRAFRRECYEDGLIDGKQEAKQEAASNFLRKGIGPEVIAICLFCVL